MSIRTKLFAACLLLIAINVGVGICSQIAQQRLGDLGVEIYDRAFMAMSYLRSAQNAMVKLRAAADQAASGELVHRSAPESGETASERVSGAVGAPAREECAGVSARAVQDIAGDVAVAHERAMSEEGERATRNLESGLAELCAQLRRRDPLGRRASLDELQTAFDNAIEIYAGDGYLHRRDVQRLVERSLRNTGLTVAASVAITTMIAFLLAGSILPHLRRAVAIARSISAGRLDNVFPTGGSGETATLMEALSIMQGSLVEKIGRIDALAADAQARAAELVLQSARFAAALDNMRHGLCMVDGLRRTLVANRRFGEMFGELEPGSDIAAWPGIPDLTQVFGATPSLLAHLRDGRAISVTAARCGRAAGC